MDFCAVNIEKAISITNSNEKVGLCQKQVEKNKKQYGINALTKKEKKGLFSKILDALSEPMLLILLVAFFITLGINLGKFFKNGEFDFVECLGIFLAITLSVSITLIMEGSSERAFNALNKIYDNILVKVLRDGKTTFISQTELVVGDIVILNSGDKVYADGRLIKSNFLSCDESALTGESLPVEKKADSIHQENVSLAERDNMVYSGTFLTSGEGVMLVTAVGDKTEIGKIAKELSEKKGETPLQQKLNKLSKTITIIGTTIAVLVTVINMGKLVLINEFTFANVQSLFVSCIVLIVASVPEGLPTIVALSLALNMIKLAKENALIKKMIATETTGAVSVICSDKTGTLTTGKMDVLKICYSSFCYLPKNLENINLIENFLLNTTAEITKINGKTEYKGSGTECALLKSFEKNKFINDVESFRKNYSVVSRVPFDNEKKIMSTVVLKNGKEKELIKGAPEKIIPLCKLSFSQKQNELKIIEKEQVEARRVLCFCHSENGEYIYDGFVSLIDPIRKDVYSAVEKCKKAGIKIKILTGDNLVTAFSIAKELKIVKDKSEVINAVELENLDDVSIEKILSRVSVIARSTPITKMRIVKCLKQSGEVVAVTGDGINDAPAIKQADVGIAMGKTGSDITKETADIVLLDDSFATIVKAISFGRNVYRNLQRFIMFQLSVNLSALLFIMVTAVLGYKPPFNTLQLLWINVIMDGPPALTLGLNTISDKLLLNKPVKRERSIVSLKMLLVIIFNGIFISTIVFLQYKFNFLRVSESEKSGVVFTLFILFQLFNAFNCKELGATSVFTGLKDNKIMLITFSLTFMIHIFIEQVLYKLFNVSPLSFLTFIKILSLSFTIVIVSEIYKLFVRIYKKRNSF